MKQEVPQAALIGILIVLVIAIGGFFIWRLSRQDIDRTPPPAGFGDPSKRFTPAAH